MTQVNEVVLFYSKFSKECVPCINFITHNRLPVALIPLDTEESRKAVFGGSIMQIKQVPSMIVSYVSGDTQLFVGSQKILMWFSKMVSPPQPTDQQPVPSNLEQHPKRNEPVKKSKKKKKTKRIVPQSDPSGHTELIFDDTESPYDMGGNSKNNSEIANLNRNIGSKLSTTQPKPSPNASIMAMATQMAAERDRQLNYDSKKES